MYVFKLIFKNAMRHRLRTFLTILGIAVAIMSFGLLRTVVAAWHAGVTQAAPDRLITRSRISITFTLPIAQKEKIEQVPGVEEVTFGTWFGGYFKDPKDFFANFAVPGSQYFNLYPEFLVEPDVLETFDRERNAAIIGAGLAERFGWEVGDAVTLTGMIYPGEWGFVIRGIYEGRDETTDDQQFLFNWDYVDQRMLEEAPMRAGQVGWWVIRIDDPAKAARISKEIDALFDNSADETLTETEAAFQQSFVAMAGTIVFSLQVISIMVIGIILLVAANTMAMTARERISEYAVLKTLGFGGGHIMGLVAGESVLIACLGGGIGLILMIPLLNGVGAALQQWFPAFPIDPMTYPQAALATIAVGILAAVFPVWRAMRVSIVDGLRRVG
ncbi:MAG: FtsX-like permease family protein [candidate division Zixibacteria bacterium]|nr:FtsX-like permease family protein [candidate division Zixibacteria bacterium]